MTFAALLVIAISEGCAIVGQVFFKLAMGRYWEQSRRRAVALLAAGVATMAVGFFLWLGLLVSFDLSFLYPFEGLSRLVLLGASAFYLKEKITPGLLLGVLLISAGVVLVASS